VFRASQVEAPLEIGAQVRTLGGIRTTWAPSPPANSFRQLIIAGSFEIPKSPWARVAVAGQLSKLTAMMRGSQR
jgi:hypothetical protein